MWQTSGPWATRPRERRRDRVVRALIAGLGAAGQRHARNLRALRPDVELMAYRQRGRSGVISNALGLDAARDPAAAVAATVFGDLDVALAAKPDIVIVCTPTSQHVPIALRAAEAGCHIYLEKPVSHSLDGLGRLASVVARKHLIVGVGCQWRFHPCVERLRDAIAHGALGDLRKATITSSEFLPDWHPYEDYRESYAARSDLGGGVILTQIHDYDLAWWLFGAAGTVMASTIAGGELGIDVEHTARAQFDAGGAQIFVRQTFAERDRIRTIDVAGTKAEARADLVAGTVRFTPPVADGVSVGEYDRNEMFVACLRDFLSCVEHGGTPRTPLEDGAGVLRVALAARESARRGTPVPAR
jgi:predicted dehydrogenase